VNMASPLLPEGVPEIDADEFAYEVKESTRREACRFPTLISKWPSIKSPEFAYNLKLRLVV